ncbi:unnamed protein product [Diatraea saccharalis]|uniref:Uncharacterized protein n=1 Tax=Diatraea saccharalis TaxID=40085 RepID=A0A9N9QUZ8_9NEOP|nr:unnamed protein product [Diatraea saccharalis]
MEKKRKRTDEEIRRKIQKLEAKLAKTTSEHQNSESSLENFNNSPPETPYTELLPYYCETDLGTKQLMESSQRELSPCPTAQPCSLQPQSPSGEALKNAPKPRFQRPNVPPTGANKGHLNFVPQHRKTDTKPVNNRRATNFSQKQPYTTNARRHNDRDRPSTSRTAPHPRR